MGVWGTGLFDDDITSDIRDDYLHQLRKKKTPEEAIDLLKKNYHPDGDSDDGYLFWLAIALTQWQYGHLSESVRQKALLALPTAGYDERWKELSIKDREKREKALKKIAQTLESPQPKPKKISPYRGSKSRLKTGEIYSIHFIDFQAPNLKKRYLDYAPYSFKFGSFCVVGIEQKENLRDEVVDEYPVIVLYDWIGDLHPTVEELADTPIIEYDEQNSHWNAFLGRAPEKFDYERNQLKLVGFTNRFLKNNFVPIYPEYCRVWSSIQLRIIENYGGRQGDG